MAVTRDLTSIWFRPGVGFSRVSTRWKSPPALSRRMPFIVVVVTRIGERFGFFVEQIPLIKSLEKFCRFLRVSQLDTALPTQGGILICAICHRDKASFHPALASNATGVIKATAYIIFQLQPRLY